jgi:solute carrier family 25 carnitine/acylcarnitine transporter 20/29
MSGVASAFLTGPTELVKCIAQTNTNSKGLLIEEYAIFRTMIQRHGWTGTHGPSRGLWMTVLRDSPSFGIYFSTYEAIKMQFGDSPFVSFCAGGWAGAFAWGAIYPIDVMKTRWQIMPPGTYTSIAHCVKVSLKEEGAGVFFKGFGATMTRAWPQSAVIFTIYESVKKFMMGTEGGGGAPAQ